MTYQEVLAMLIPAYDVTAPKAGLCTLALVLGVFTSACLNIAAEAADSQALASVSANAEAKKESVNLSDDKITTSERSLEQRVIEKSDKYAEPQAKVVNKVPGPKVSPADLKEGTVKKKAAPNLNPLSWLLRPITRLQEQSIRLEQQIIKLTGPISALQPSMLSLEDKMGGVQKSMGSMQTTINGVQGTMHRVHDKMTGVQNQIGGMHNQMAAMQHEMQQIRSDIGGVRTDMSGIKKPITDLREPIMQLRGPLLAVQKPVSEVDLRLANLDRQLSDLKGLLSLILTAIFAAAALIAIGTPIAAILVWRNRQKLLPKPTPQEKLQDAKLHRAGQRIDTGLNPSG
jgi:chromosome segregation ATPase